MAHIKIDTDSLLQHASEVNSHVESYSALGGRVNTVTSQMLEGWEGKAAQAYLSMMQNYMQQGEKMKTVLQNFSRIATEVANDMIDTDQKCAALIRNAF